MDYYVIGPDGAEYGPANLATIAEWVGQGRVSANTKLKDFQTGAIREASTFRELFPAQTVPPISSAPPMSAGSPYPRQYATPPTATRPVQSASSGAGSWFSGPGSGDLYWALARCLISLLLCAFSPLYAIVSAIYGIIRSGRVLQAGHRLGMASLIVSVVVLIIVLIRAALWYMMPHASTYSN